MIWKIPPRIKIYEALGTIADKRIIIDKNIGKENDYIVNAKVYSSTKEKYYDVKYDEKDNSIMCNDNGSYWQGYLGYPSIAVLMLKGKIKYNALSSEALKGIKWKEINTRFKNDYEKTEEYVLEYASENGIDIDILKKEIDEILTQIKKLNIEKLGTRIRPP